MVAFNLPKTIMPNIITQIQRVLPAIRFAENDSFCWSYQDQCISYPQNALSSSKGRWALLHEAGHAALNHRTYKHDLDLLLLEVAAWDKARELAKRIGYAIDENHIQDCLDTYRDWLHERSTCPRCGTNSTQSSAREYQCYNCFNIWRVSDSRFCRPYRLSKFSAKTKKSPEKNPFQATFREKAK